MLFGQVNKMSGLLVLWAFLGGYKGYSQQASLEEKTLLHDNLWTSARAAGTGGALAGLADGMDAPYYNPAGIGGLHTSKKESNKAIRFIGFPYGGVAVGENSVALNKEFSSTDEAGADPVVTRAVLDAHEGNRQYARFSLVPAFVVSRFMVAYIYDSQIAAIGLQDGSGLIRTAQMETSGLGAGFSATDPDGKFYIGAFAASLEKTTLQGDLSFNQIADPVTRKDVIKDAKKKYKGTAAHAGILWRIAKKAKPSLGLVVRNAGDSKYESSDPSEDAMVVEEDVALALTISPQLGKWGFFSFSLEGDHLTDHKMAVKKKLKAGMEMTIGGLFGNSSGFGLRAGYNVAGASYGFHANLGLVGIALSSYAEDIGLENKQMVERRYVGVASVNVAH